jgi:CheY-like chemotaxis protein
MQEMLDELHKIPGNPSGAVLEEGAGPIRGTILLADDNEVILETVSDFLRSRSYNVVTARDGRQMVDLAMEVNPDLILADVQMPGTDGLMAMREIRALDHPALARVPIIAMTALAMPGDEELCLRAGANRYISKPVKLEKLVGLIREIMENRG